MDTEFFIYEKTRGDGLFYLRPSDSPPASTAPYEVRAEWSERYVNWLIAQTPPEGPLPFDVDPSHRYQIEFFSCVTDPQAYARRTAAELAMADETPH
jgi:hypothetical protein